MRKDETRSRTGWWRMGVRLSLVSFLSITLALGSILAVPSPVQAATIYVDDNNCPGPGSGTQASPYCKIQDAINAAGSSDTIKVAQGTYNENLVVSKAITLLGGYSPPGWTTQGPASSTTINGSGSDSVIYVDADATIDNFKLTGGSGHFNDGHNEGGGIFIPAGLSSPIISDNIIQSNSAHVGGGICCRSTGLPQILRNTISGNTANRLSGSLAWGGGLFVAESSPTIKDNTISDNHAYWGGGMLLEHSVSIVEGNTISGNIAEGSYDDSVGGALFIEEAVPIIRNNVIANNKAWRRADGIYLKRLDPWHPGAQAQIVNNTIVNNRYSDTDKHEGISIKGEGGNIISPIIRNNIVVLNGCGIRIFSDGTPVYPVLSNNDVWGNTVINYAGLSPGPGDISADPRFVNQGSGDYHLQEGSPCIDAGASSDAPSTDFEEDPRPADGDRNGSALWDIGADEYAVWIAKQARPTSPEPGDIITYTITYRNNGAPATGVVITDLLSADLLNPAFTSSGANITPRGGTTYVWDVDNLAPGSGGIITITAQVDPSVVTPTVMWNTAEFYVPGSGSFSDDALIIVGGLETYLPLIFKSY